MKKLFALILFMLVATVTYGQTKGPLRACTSNPRYFCDVTGEPVLLAGLHTWWNLYDHGAPFDFAGYLDFLQAKNHNFVRLWAWEETRGNCCTEPTLPVGPEFPWLRTGPGLANDGLPKFDLSRPNPAFHQRLRQRVLDAGARNIYVSIMLFEGWELINDPEFWPYHPFHPSNNIQGIDGQGATYHTLTNPAVTALQVAYIHAVLDTVNDLDNVLYEISNESSATVPDNAWQYALISEIKTYEGTLAKQHPVGMTWQARAENSHGNAPLWASVADWIGPGCVKCWGGGSADDYAGNPPASTGAKVVLADTDHVYGEGGDAVWVWKSFLRGLNPIFMDRAPFINDWRESARNAMGIARNYAARVDLLEVTPQNSWASHGYCLCSTDEYLALAFTSGKGNRRKTQVALNLSAGTFTVEWLNLSTNAVTVGPNVNGGSVVTFNAPFHAAWALLVQRAGPAPDPEPDPEPEPVPVGFYRAINLGGTAVTVDGRAWEGNSAANYSYNGSTFCNQNVTLNPPTDAARAAMIRCSVYSFNGSNVALLAVPAGGYDVYLYVWEDNNSVTRNVLLEGQIVQASVVSGSAGSWQKLGPFRVTIGDGSINVSTSPTGDPLNLSGLEVWRVN